jgi:hypothetical protein
MQTFQQWLDPYLPVSTDVVALLVLVLLVPLLAFFTARARRGWSMPLRPVGAFTRLASLSSRAAEAGRPLHVSLGRGMLGTQDTAEALAGLEVLSYVARRGATLGQPPLATMGDATLLPMAQGVTDQALREAAHADQYQASVARFSGPDGWAYAAGTATNLDRVQTVGTAYWGRFGAEGLWLAEDVAARHAAPSAGQPTRVPQMGGSAEPDAIALLQVPLDDWASGEEILAAGAYLHRPSHIGSLAAQDVLRSIVIVAIIVGVALFSLGWIG